MNEDLPKDWDDVKVRREIVASSDHISGTLFQLNRILHSPTLDRCIDWLLWLKMAAETYESYNT